MPAVQDSKRALDEYTSEIFMGGRNTIVMHNTCEDSLLVGVSSHLQWIYVSLFVFNIPDFHFISQASPLIIDLAILAELSQRIVFSVDGGKFEFMHPVLSILRCEDR